MNSRRAALRVSTMLLLASIACVALRVHVRHRARVARGDSVWRLTYHVDLQAPVPGTRLRIAFPIDTPQARVFRQALSPAELTSERLGPVSTEVREVSAVTQRAGLFEVAAQFDIHMSPRAGWKASPPDPNLTAEARAACLESSAGIQVSSPIVLQTLDRLSDQPVTKSDLMERIFEYCLVELGIAPEDSPQDAATVIEQGAAGSLGRARAMVALCRAGKIPARLVTGFEIKRDTGARPHTWAEVLVNGHWEPYDPENGFARELPHNFLPVRRNGTEIIRAARGAHIKALYTIERLPPPPGMPGSARPHWLEIADLGRLPLEVHQVLSLILLLPFGAVVTCLFRTVIGIRTFGTFTPTLLAVSFIYADWRTGLVVLGCVVALGLASRALLDQLKLLMVPRLSVILTLVVLSIVLAVSVVDYFGFTPGAQAVLLPMVILTMVIERFYLTTDEDGVPFAFQLLAGTLLVALCCYFVLAWNAIGQMILVYPEIHLATLAVLIMIGRYTGYRLTELWRFRELARPGSGSSEDPS